MMYSCIGALTQHGTCRQWLKWLREQVSGVVDQMDDEEQQIVNQTKRLLSPDTEPGRGIDKGQGICGHHGQHGPKHKYRSGAGAPDNLQNATLESEVASATSTAPKKDIEREQEMLTLREELVAQEALKEGEREQKKTVEEERRRMEENLWKSQANNDRLKEEHEKLLQDKDKLVTENGENGNRTAKRGTLATKGQRGPYTL